MKKIVCVTSFRTMSDKRHLKRLKTSLLQTASLKTMIFMLSLKWLRIYQFKLQFVLQFTFIGKSMKFMYRKLSHLTGCSVINTLFSEAMIFLSIHTLQANLVLNASKGRPVTMVYVQVRVYITKV